jgi:3-deoxy-D-manno-octulosonate 8-phosphate phosphatase (KDO 8-P phosphatase)
MSTSDLKKIKLLLLDVDGVLTRGDIVYDDNGVQSKTFNSKDGVGIRLLMDAGIPVGLVTGRKSAALEHRCNNLGINLLYDGVHDKAALLGEISTRTGFAPSEIAFVGDDLPDLPIMNLVGVAVAVADAVPTVCRMADIVTTAKGGRGAVREICEAILDAKGLMRGILEGYGVAF